MVEQRQHDIGYDSSSHKGYIERLTKRKNDNNGKITYRHVLQEQTGQVDQSQDHQERCGDYFLRCEHNDHGHHDEGHVRWMKVCGLYIHTLREEDKKIKFTKLTKCIKNNIIILNDVLKVGRGIVYDNICPKRANIFNFRRTTSRSNRLSTENFRDVRIKSYETTVPCLAYWTANDPTPPPPA